MARHYGDAFGLDMGMMLRARRPFRSFVRLPNGQEFETDTYGGAYEAAEKLYELRIPWLPVYLQTRNGIVKSALRLYSRYTLPSNDA